MSASLQLLLRAPEMAVLDALEATLTASSLALTAAWPELEAEDFAAAPSPPPALPRPGRAWLTRSSPTWREALHQSLRRYRSLLVMQEVWACHASADEYTTP